MPQAPIATNEVDARATLSAYLILGAFPLLLTLFGIYVAIREPVPDWNLLYISIGLFVFVVVLLRSFRLRIADGKLCSTRFFWTRSIRLGDIEKVETKLFGTSKGSYRALVVYPLAEKMQKPMRVPLGPFSKKDLKRLFDLLGPKFQGTRNIGVYKDEIV